jgi:outer membrane protein assembly factor BamD (BamD/ComL family)
MNRAIVLALACLVLPAFGQKKVEDGPTSEKAKKAYREAFEYLHQRRTEAALEGFKKADKQDGGRCMPCQRKVIQYGMELRDW